MFSVAVQKSSRFDASKVKLYFPVLCAKILWSRVSNALQKSKNNFKTDLPWSIALKTFNRDQLKQKRCFFAYKSICLVQ